MTAKVPFVTEARYVIQRKVDGEHRFAAEKSKVGNNVMLYENKESAAYALSLLSETAQLKRNIRPATEEELSDGVLITPKMSHKLPSLVELYEDLDERRFAISSRCLGESEFVDEFVREFYELPVVTNSAVSALRLRSFLALMVDMCCKYRGYKAEKVMQRTILIAGDLEIPRVQFPVEDSAERRESQEKAV